MEKIEKLVCEVLEKYDKDYSHVGVSENLEEWKKNKGELINILRKHPNWDEDALAVKFDIKEYRIIDSRIVWENRRRLHQIAVDLEISNDLDLLKALAIACEDNLKTIVRSATCQRIKELTGVNCREGQKTSRVINKICIKFGIDKHPDYNAVFAKMSDALNPLQIEKKALLSVHPCDFLEMSSNINSWSSCHCLSGGEYQAGTLSYMNDGVSMIFYTVDYDIDNMYFKAQKRTREVFCFGKGILLQSRLYPDTNCKEKMIHYRNLVQKTFALCLDVPNSWELKQNEDEDITVFCDTDNRSLHYEDYIYSCNNANISVLESVFEDEDTIIIGNIAYCLYCECSLYEPDSVLCDECREKIYCNSCGDRISVDDSSYINGENYCSNCVIWCECCEENCVGETYEVINSVGYNENVCQDCYDEYYHQCEECGEYCNIDYIYNINYETYCKDCIENKFHTCEVCEEYVKMDKAVEIDDCFYCEDCANENRGQAI